MFLYFTIRSDKREELLKGGQMMVCNCSHCPWKAASRRLRDRMEKQQTILWWESPSKILSSLLCHPNVVFFSFPGRWRMEFDSWMFYHRLSFHRLTSQSEIVSRKSDLLPFDIPTVSW